MEKLKRGMIDVFFANAFSLLLGLVTGFIMPKMLSVDSYAGIKTYQLYVSYIGFLHLGFVDGIYLKFGGYEYSDLDKKQLQKPYVTLILFQTVVAVCVIFGGMILKDDALIFFAFSIIPLNMLNFYKNIYQATGEFKKYKSILQWNTIMTFCMIVFLLFVLKIHNYMFFFIGYTIVNLVVWILTEIKASIACWSVKYFDIKELVGQIRTGIVLMLGNFSSILLTSMDRWFIKLLMNTVAFAEYSFAVSMENLLSIAITPITTTLYNFFCNNKEQSRIIAIRRYLTIFSVVIASAAFSVKFIIENFLQKYSGSMQVLFLLFASQILFVPIKGLYVNLYKVEKKQNRYFTGMVFVLIVGAVLNVLIYTFLNNKEAFAIGTLMAAFFWYFLCCFDFKFLNFPIREILYSMIEVVFLCILGQLCPAISGFVFYVVGTIFLTIVFFYKESKALIKSIKKMI